MRRNLTIVLDEESARWVRVEAARRDTSVSQYVAELVERERQRAESYQAPLERFLARRPRALGPPGQRLPTRDELHER